MPQGLSLGDETQSLEIVESETVYRGAIWDVRRETFDYRGEKLTRDFVDHPGAVSVVALNDNAEIMMIRQYRHAIRALDWEIPAGLLDIPGGGSAGVCAAGIGRGSRSGSGYVGTRHPAEHHAGRVK